MEVKKGLFEELFEEFPEEVKGMSDYSEILLI